MFERKVEKILYEYYERKDDPILILTGARQIGKTFIIEHTAKKAFKNFVEINLKDDELEGKIFSGSYGIDTFYYKLSSVCGDNLGSYDDTIVFLDEIKLILI